MCGVIPSSSAAFLITVNVGVGWGGTKPLTSSAAEKKIVDIYEFGWVIFSNMGKKQTEDLDFQGDYMLPTTSHLVSYR